MTTYENREKTDSVVIEVIDISKKFRVYESRQKDCSGNKNEKEELLRRSKCTTQYKLYTGKGEIVLQLTGKMEAGKAHYYK